MSGIRPCISSLCRYLCLVLAILVSFLYEASSSEMFIAANDCSVHQDVKYCLTNEQTNKLIIFGSSDNENQKLLPLKVSVHKGELFADWSPSNPEAFDNDLSWPPTRLLGFMVLAADKKILSCIKKASLSFNSEGLDDWEDGRRSKVSQADFKFTRYSRTDQFKFDTVHQFYNSFDYHVARLTGAINIGSYANVKTGSTFIEKILLPAEVLDGDQLEILASPNFSAINMIGRKESLFEKPNKLLWADIEKSISLVGQKKL